MGVIRITGTDVPELQIYTELSESRLSHYYEPEEGIFIAESAMIIRRALDAGYEPLSLLTEEKYVRDLSGHTGQEVPLGSRKNGDAPEELIRSLADRITVYAAPLEVLTSITGYALTRGILCAMRRKPLPAAEEIWKPVSRLVVLERVMNPTNIGAIFRSAAALGMDGILLTKGCADPLYRRAARVSMGTVFQIPWTYIRHWPEGIRDLQTAGFQVAAMALEEDSVPLQEYRLLREQKAALVMGTEGYGLAEDTLQACDLTVQIPMAHGVDSLNVAAASAVVFWHINPLNSMHNVHE